MNYARLHLNINSLQLNHQQFFYFDSEDNLKTTNETWPELKTISPLEELGTKAVTMLLTIQFLVKEDKIIHISREIVSKKSRRIAKKSANLNEILHFLHERGYINFQYAGVYGRKQFITINPKIFIQ